MSTPDLIVANDKANDKTNDKVNDLANESNELVFDSVIILIEDDSQYNSYSVAEVASMCVGVNNIVKENINYKHLVPNATQELKINKKNTLIEILKIINCLNCVIEKESGSFYSVALKPTMCWTVDNSCIIGMVSRF